MIDKQKLITAVKSLLQEEMIEQEDVSIIKSYIDNNEYERLYGKLKWELVDSDIYYNSESKE
tara:strand:+ start:1893 stop:2078 length:186 start_codon:yes stop_codon:yes gene_type:complete